MMKKYPINPVIIRAKIRASLLHFLCSLLIFLVALAWIKVVLYPDFHFQLNGVIYGLRIVAGVDLILGPLLTILVYHSMKPLKEKISDFVVIGIVQIAALSYGLFTMYQEHPKLLSYYQYGTATTITQREWNELKQSEEADQLPTDLHSFQLLAGVPLLNNQRHLGTIFGAIDLDTIQKGDAHARRDLSYDDDKTRLAEIEREHGKVYIFAVLGKYQGMYVAMNDKMEIVATFGQRDLH